MNGQARKPGDGADWQRGAKRVSGDWSLDVVELDPALDVRNGTADLAADLIESQFGKSTLMRN